MVESQRMGKNIPGEHYKRKLGMLCSYQRKRTSKTKVFVKDSMNAWTKGTDHQKVIILLNL